MTTTNTKFVAINGLDNNNQPLSNVATPVNPEDAATKNYVDSKNKFFYENKAIIDTNATIATGNNALSAGPVTVADGISVTIPNGSVWTIV